MKRLMILMTALFLIAAGQVRAEGIDFQHLSLKEALTKAKKEDKMVFVDVYATWCGPCHYLSDEIFPDKELGEVYNKKFISIKVDGETEEGEELMARHELDAYPSLLILDTEGELVGKRVGVQAPDALIGFAEDATDPDGPRDQRFEARFEKGDRDKEFLAEYMELLYELDDAEKLAEVADVYFTKFPKLDLEDESDFTAFVMGVTDFHHPSVKGYLKKVEHFEDENPETFSIVFGNILDAHMERAIQAEDFSILDEALEPMTEAWAKVDDEAMSYEELRERAQQWFDATLEEPVDEFGAEEGGE